MGKSTERDEDVDDEYPAESEKSEAIAEPIDLSIEELSKESGSVGAYIVPLDATSIEGNTQDTEVIKADVKIANGVLRAVGAGWNNVKTLSDVRMLAKLTLDIVERRRKLLNHQHGPANQTKTLNLNDYIS